MNQGFIRQLAVLVSHPDAIVRAGVVASLHRYAPQGISVYDIDDSAWGLLPIDVVIADYDNAILLTDPIRRRRDRFADARILALTANDREVDIRQAIQAGVHGYMLLGTSLDDLVEAIRKLANGTRCLCPVVAERIAESLAMQALTARENDVLRFLTAGESNKVIAKLLDIEVGTVKSHVRGIMAKLGAISRTQAVSIAVTRGLVVQPRRSQPAATPAAVSQVIPLRNYTSDARPKFA